MKWKNYEKDSLLKNGIYLVCGRDDLPPDMMCLSKFIDQHGREDDDLDPFKMFYLNKGTEWTGNTESENITISESGFYYPCWNTDINDYILYGPIDCSLITDYMELILPSDLKYVRAFDRRLPNRAYFENVKCNGTDLEWNIYEKGSEIESGVYWVCERDGNYPNSPLVKCLEPVINKLDECCNSYNPYKMVYLNKGDFWLGSMDSIGFIRVSGFYYPFAKEIGKARCFLFGPVDSHVTHYARMVLPRHQEFIVCGDVFKNPNFAGEPSQDDLDVLIDNLTCM